MLENRVASRIFSLNGETAFTIMHKANKIAATGHDIIHLEIGQPDFTTSRNIIDAAYAAMLDGKTGYTPTSGIPELREAIAEHCLKYKNVVTNKKEIVVVPGGKPVMFYTMLLLVEPGDEVICPNPGFPIYESIIKFAGGKPVYMPLLEEKEFSLDIEAFQNSITDRTKLIILNNPSNPTGGVIPESDIRAIADIIKDKDIYVLSDDIYDRIYFDEKPFSIASIPEMKDKTIILDGFSKSYSMTGWRIGYGVMNRDLAKKMALLMVNSNSCTAAPTQWAAVEALTGPQDEVENMVGEFKKRRDFVVNSLNSIKGIHCAVPKGAFYAFPNISSFGLSSDEFANRLLEEGYVATSSGTGFGKHGENYIRLSYASSLESLEKAIERINQFVQTL